MVEQWRPIVGFEDSYQVSNLGNVRSVVFRNGNTEKLLDTPRNRVVSAHPKTGYLCISLSKNGKSHPKLVHRLVLEAFHGPCPDGCESGHLDHDRANNSLDNLAWITRKKNAEQRVARGTQAGGESSPNAKLKAKDIPIIKSDYKKHNNKALVARKFGVSRRTIKNIVDGTAWINIGGQP